MANLPESSNFDAGVYEIQTTDLVLGGPSGPANSGATNLTNRTRWLFDQNAANVAELAAHAAQLGTLIGSVTSLNGSVAAINAHLATLDGEVVLLAPIGSPSLTGVPKAPTAAAGTATTQIATTAFVNAAVAPLAPIASPALSGLPTAPTAAPGTATAQLATTAFVMAAVNAGSSITGNGYIKFASGLILQWGFAFATGPVTFPIAFPNAIFAAFCTGNRNSTGSNGANYAFNTALSGMNVIYDNTGGWWFAIGN